MFVPRYSWYIVKVGVKHQSIYESILAFCVVILCVIRFWVPCCDVRYDFRIKTMFGSSLPPVVCRRAHVLFTLFVFACVKWCPMHIVLCFVFLRLVWPMLRVSLDRPFLIAPLVFSNFYWNSIMPNSVIYCWSFQMHPAKKLEVVVMSLYYKLHPHIMVNHHVINKWCK